jgi:hypothetical protein
MFASDEIPILEHRGDKVDERAVIKGQPSWMIVRVRV